MKLGLSRINSVLKKLSHPEKRFPHLLIGGTNGKGTVAYNVSRQFGWTHSSPAGLFLSPHLVNLRERITLGGQWLEDAQWQAAEQQLLNTGMADQLTFFETLLVIAVLIFAEQAVPFAVFEVGLGGRYDATNALTPIASMVTNVSLDHQDILGSTIEAIALEKIEIARAGRPFFLPASLLAIPSVNQRLSQLGCQVIPQPDAADAEGNLSLVKSLCEHLGFWQPDRPLVMLPGRREILVDGSILLDGAHNPASWQALVPWIRAMGHTQVDIVAGLTQGRSPEQFMTLMAPICRSLRVWQGWDERALPIHDWPAGVDCIQAPIMPSDDGVPLLVCGSLYMVGAYRDWLSTQGYIATVEQTMSMT